MTRLKATFAALLCLLALAGCASTAQGDRLLKAQYAYSEAVRWGNFEGAWQLVDPEYRKAHPMSAIELARYGQVAVSGYRDLASRMPAPDLAEREIQIGVVNRHTMVERNTRYTERWRYDPVAKTWWLTVGLPDFWQGE